MFQNGYYTLFTLVIFNVEVTLNQQQNTSECGAFQQGREVMDSKNVLQNVQFV